MANVIKQKFQDEMGSNLNRYRLTNVTSGESANYDLIRTATITQEGTPLNAEVFNEIIDSINEGFEKGVSKQTNTTTITLDISGNNVILNLPTSSSSQMNILNYGVNSFDTTKAYILELPYMASLSGNGYLNFYINGNKVYLEGDEKEILPTTYLPTNQYMLNVRILLYAVGSVWYGRYISGTTGTFSTQFPAIA